MEDESQIEIQSQMKDQIEDQIEDQMKDQMEDQMEDQIEDQMEDQSEIGGAQALLQLGTKLKHDIEDSFEYGHEDASNDRGTMTRNIDHDRGTMTRNIDHDQGGMTRNIDHDQGGMTQNIDHDQQEHIQNHIQDDQGQNAHSSGEVRDIQEHTQGHREHQDHLPEMTRENNQDHLPEMTREHQDHLPGMTRENNQNNNAHLSGVDQDQSSHLSGANQNNNAHLSGANQDQSPHLPGANDHLPLGVNLDEPNTSQNLHHVQYDHQNTMQEQHHYHQNDDDAPNLELPDHGYQSDLSHHQDHNPEHQHALHHHHHEGDIDDDELSDSKTNQQITDAVEAAVMRYVGGTLDSTVNPTSPSNEPSSPISSHKHNKRKLNAEDVINDYQWDRFLAEEVANASAATNDNGHPSENRSLDHDQDILFDDYNPLSNKSTPRKRRRKSNLHISDESIISQNNHNSTQQHHNNNHETNHDNNEIADKNHSTIVSHANNSHTSNYDADMDPDLSTLNVSSEHDQLVRAAIMGAGELAKQLGAGGSLSDSESISSHHSIHSSLHHLPPHQAQQVLAAATAAVSNQANGFPNPESVAAINQLAQAASSLSGSLLHDKYNDTSSASNAAQDNNAQLKNKRARRPNIKKKSTSPSSQQPQLSSTQQTEKGQIQAAKQDNISSQSTLKSQPIAQISPLLQAPQFPSRARFNEFTSIESLIQEISDQACNWYNLTVKNGTTSPGPRPFSPEEIDAVDHFVSGYCHINRLTREDVCARVWANDRTKDSFWESLTRILPYRSRASVYKHMKRQYHIFTVRAKWTKEDDVMLSELASKKTSNWKVIGETMGRMPEDCRDRWRNYVKCGDNRALNKWSEEEEQKLKNVVMEMASSTTKETNNSASINWTLVSEKMNGQRSRIQCRYKWNKIIKRESLERVSRMNSPTKIWLLSTLQRCSFSESKTIDWDHILDLFNQATREDSPHSKELNKDVIYNTNDLVNWFDRSKTAVKEHRTLPLNILIERLLQNLYGSSLLDHSISLHDSSRIPSMNNTSTSQGESLDLDDLNPSLDRTSDPNTLANITNLEAPASKLSNSPEQDIEKENSRTKIKPKAKKPKSKPVKFDAEANSIATAAVAAVSASVDEQDTQQQEYSLWR